MRTLGSGLAAALVIAVLVAAGRPVFAAHHSDIASAAGINLKALLHDSWDPAYRSPFGAVPSGTQVTVRLRTAARGASRVVLFLKITDQSGNPLSASHQTMKRAAGKKYDLWSATIATPKVGIYTYSFQVTRGRSVAWYAPTFGRDGGVGQAYPGKTEPTDAYRITVYVSGFTAVPWVSSAIIYQIFPDRFYDGDPSNDIPFHSSSPVSPSTGGTCPAGSYPYGGFCAYTHTSWSELPENPGHGEDFFGGDLQGIIDKLPYLKDLGVNTLYLTPIFLSPSNHKYDTSDYFTIDPHFGTLQTLQQLLTDAHADGMHVILDGVFNHTGSDSIYFNRYGHFPDVGAYQSQQSPYYPWYTFLAWPDSYVDFGGFDSLPQLAETDPVKDFIFRTSDSVAQHYLALGSDGWRLDAAQNKSHQWWQEFRAAVKARFPDDILIAEDTGGPTDPTPFIMGNEVDGIMNYNFRDAVVSFFTNGAVGSSGGTARTFVNNLMAMAQNYPRPALYSSMNLVDSHDTERILTDLGGNKTELKEVAALQLSWLGTPTIYYGDEAGLMGQSDPDSRRTFPWDNPDTDLQAYYKKLISIRTANPVLQDGSVFPLLVDNANRTVAFLRADAQQHAVIIVNDGASARTLHLSGTALANGTSLTNALTGKSAQVAGGKLTATVAAHTVAILLQSP